MHFDFRKLDVFSFGEEQKCLIGSVDLLYRNSWNEVRTLHFNGEQAMIEALKTILGKMHQDAAPPDSVEVFCYSQHLRGLIRTRVQQMISECIELRLSSTRQDTGRFKALRVSGQRGGCSSSGLTFRCRSWKTPLSSTAPSRTTSCTGCRCRWKPITLAAGGGGWLPPARDYSVLL
ncbi:adenylate cyclase [Klebsiella pneumoniae]|uniref:Adenylate cyclase n=1 Tax=Klebsiella pneumoniae TaxID=573 RepID=A0A378FUC7_KLEPN|nr:adenylate cyclase [Klebsiella pneumoniae]